MEADWELSQSFTSDGQGIRCAAILEPTKDDASGSSTYRIVTGTQGGALVEFQVPSGALRVLPFQHDHAITALLAGPDCYITGCKDHQIRVFSSTTHELVCTLQGHEKPVTSLAWADPESQQFLVSGSWDGTAKVWNVAKRSMMATLPDHENSVCVTGLPSSDDGDTIHTLLIATGSAGMAQGNAIVGHTVRIWKVDAGGSGSVQLLQSVANDHDGPIRAILGGKEQMATCSNDGTVKLRDPRTGASQSTLACVLNDPPILLSLAAPPDASYLAAGTEDGHLVIWQGDSPPMILRHTQTVWTVVTIPTTHDLLTCCQDGSVRIFTRSTERMAPAAEREAFAAAATAAAQKTSAGPSADEIAKLPKWEDQMTIPGRSEGQVQLFQKNGTAIAAQWSATSQTWIEVGEVTGRSGETLDGVQYDHVFPIEVEMNGGVANLQMGYNNGENPFVAAQRFVDAHQLPQYHLSQIADYIQQRVGQQPTTLGMAAPAATPVVPAVTYEYIPVRTYKSFELSEKTAATTLDKMKNKIQEFGTNDSSETMQHIASLMSTLAAGNRYHSSKVTDTEMKTVGHLLNTSPPNQVFPALDLARLAILHPDAASKSIWVTIVQRTLALATTETTSLEGPSAVAVPMLSLRLFSNAFKGGAMAKQAVTTYLDPILDCAAQYIGSSNKNIRLSVATLLFNASFYLHQTKSEPRDATALKIVELVERIIDSKTYEGEALFRVLVAVGTLLLDFPTIVKPAAQQLTSKVEMAASPHGANVKAVAKEVYAVLQ